MTINKKKAAVQGLKEVAIQISGKIPALSLLIEGFRKYQEDIEEQQRKAALELITERLEQIENDAHWYRTDEGQVFTKKVIATMLNAEYTDKLEYLANALTNGPTLDTDNARRLKFVEMIRQVSKPALELLITLTRLPSISRTQEIDIGVLADHLNWNPSIVDACVRELYSVGAFSHVTQWNKVAGEIYPSTSFSPGIPAVNEFTIAFVKFFSDHSKN